MAPASAGCARWRGPYWRGADSRAVAVTFAFDLSFERPEYN
jgi:hypothetical protein